MSLANQTGRISRYCARHLFALLITVTVPCVLWTVAYFALLLWAAFTDGGIGGPLAYPGGLVLVFAAAIVASLVLLFPSTAIAESIARRRSLPVPAQIPISIAVLAFLCLVISCIAAVVGTQPSFRSVFVNFGALFVAHLLPLGLYWWVAQGGPLLLSLFQRMFSIFRS